MSDAISAIPIIGPLLGGVMDVFGAGPQSLAEKRQENMADYLYGKNADLQAQNIKSWQENAFPSAALLASQRASGLATLGTERSNRYEQLARNLSVRGIGPGSPFAGSPASAIEGSYMTGLGNLQNTLINSANTPRFRMPFGTAPGVPSTAASSNQSNPLAMALGMYAGSKLFNKSGTGTTTPTAAPGVGGYDIFSDIGSLYGM